MKPESKSPKLRYYLLLIAAVMAIAVFAYFGSPTNSHYNPAEHDYSAQDRNPSADILTSMPPNEDAINKVEKPYTQGQKEQYAANRSDLAAQWAMAQYTFVGLAVGIIGIILIVLTYYQSSRAAYFTEQALNDTKDSSYKELRAYLGVTVALKAGKDTEPVIAEIRLKNFGQTPAYKVSHGSTFSNSIDPRGIKPSNADAILNPTEVYTFAIQGPHNIGEIKGYTFYRLMLDIYFTDMNGRSRWLKYTFSTKGSDYPRIVTTVQMSRTIGTEAPKVTETVKGSTKMQVDFMDTSDLREEDSEQDA